MREPESLALMAVPGGQIDPGRCWQGAEILCLDPLGADRRGDARAAAAGRERSLHLYRLLEPRRAPAPDLPRGEERVREMEGSIQAREDEATKVAVEARPRRTSPAGARAGGAHCLAADRGPD